MNDVAIIAEISRELDAAREHLDHYARQSRFGVWLGPPKRSLEQMSERLVQALVLHPKFGLGRSVFFGEKQLTLHPRLLPFGLWRVAADAGPESAVAWLHKIYEVARADLLAIAAVYGLMIKHTITLSNGVTIMPLNELPRSPNVAMLENQSLPRPGMIPHDSIIASLNVAVIRLSGIEARPFDEVRKSITDKAFEDIHRAVKGFTLAEGGAPVVGISWVDFCDPELTLASVGQIWMGAQFEGSLNRVPTLGVDDDALEWAERYLKLDPGMWNVLDIAIDRLNLARRRVSLGDKAIEGAICLESLLGDDAPQELTYKLKLRAALLLGVTVAERREIRNTVGKLYSARSKIVHGRTSATKVTGTEAKAILEGLEVCSRAVRAVVRMNCKPEPAEWELAGGIANSRTDDAL